MSDFSNTETPKEGQEPTTNHRERHRAPIHTEYSDLPEGVLYSVPGELLQPTYGSCEGYIDARTRAGE